jgi:hypothetical protein
VRVADPRFRPAWLPLVGLPIFLAAGCGPHDTAANRPAEPSARRDVNPSAAEVRIQPVKFSGLDRFLGEQRGKVVVMDVWADW